MKAKGTNTVNIIDFITNAVTIGPQNPHRIFVYRDLEDLGYRYLVERVKANKKPRLYDRKDLELVVRFTVKYTVK